VYILAAAAAVRLARAFTRLELRSGRAQLAVAIVVVLPAIVLSNLDVLGATQPMELLLFQPTHWSYVWSR
jgi:uncharacterized membrane protein (DUF4010 family)